MVNYKVAKMKNLSNNWLVPDAVAVGILLGEVIGCGNAAEYTAYEEGL